MCMITHWKKPKLAKKDITCYKLVQDTVINHGNQTVIISGVLSHSYILGEIYKVHDEDCFNYCYPTRYYRVSVWDSVSRSVYNLPSRFDIDYAERKGLKVISIGFHSAEQAKRYKYNILRKRILVRCIIPKGSLYYKSKDGLIVSNQIIIDSIVKPQYLPNPFKSN